MFFLKKHSGQSDMWLIAGLGNPGIEYENTRHNVGFKALDALSARFGASGFSHKFDALYAKADIGGAKSFLVKPQTFMNLSGRSVSKWLNYYKIPVSRLIVIYDDIDLELGKIRIRAAGGPGTHNGMKNIIAQIQDQDFPRIRIGIGPADVKMDLAKFVLAKLSPREESTLNEIYKSAAESVELIVNDGIKAAQSKYN